jgi:hypothetical protein
LGGKVSRSDAIAAKIVERTLAGQEGCDAASDGLLRWVQKCINTDEWVVTNAGGEVVGLYCSMHVIERCATRLNSLFVSHRTAPGQYLRFPSAVKHNDFAKILKAHRLRIKRAQKRG